MLPDPIHPAVVHFPVVLAFLLPISALVAILTIRKGTRVKRAWLVPLAIAGALSLSTWVSVETGEGQSERVERVVREQPLETHEEAAESFMTGSAILLVVVAAGLLRGPIGKISRIASAVGAVALVAGAAYVGHTGGQLVYRYGAASAYVSPSAGTATEPAGGRDASLASTQPGVRGSDNDE